jgi:hypothetical protein
MKKSTSQSSENRLFRSATLLALIAVFPLFGETQSPVLSPTNAQILNHDITDYIVPIGADNNINFYLKITPPEGTYTTGEQYNQFQKKFSNIVEYIPKGENFENWSSIFTIDQMIENKTGMYSNRSNQIILHLICNTTQLTQKASVIYHKTILEKDFFVSKMAIQYQQRNGGYELLYAEYYSKGSIVCGVQYTKKLSSWLNSSEAQNEVTTIVKKISDLTSVVREHKEAPAGKTTPNK